LIFKVDEIKNILRRIIAEYHGKNYAFKTIKDRDINKEDIDSIDFTDDEIEFCKYLNNVSNTENHKKYIYSKIKSTETVALRIQFK
jgi:hypothetical protein